MTKRFFMYDPGMGGIDLFDTQEEAVAAAQAAIDEYRDTADGEWSEEVAQILVGTVTHKSVEVDIPLANGVEKAVDYQLSAVTE